MKLWAGVFAVLLVALIIGADLGYLSLPNIVYRFPYGDKVVHFVLFGLMSLLANLAIFEAQPRRSRVSLALMTCLLLALLIGFEEYSQQWLPSRQASLGDFAAGVLGVVVFAWLAIAIDRRKRNRLQAQS